MFKEQENILFRVAYFTVLYLLAVVAAFFLSFGVSFALALLLCPISVVCIVTGFMGVFLPSFFLPRPSRWFCSIFLLVLGAGFYYFRFIRQVHGEDPEVTMLQPASSLLALVLGGVAAIIIHWLFRRPNTMTGCKFQK
jgi:hypothetical protein